MKFHAKNLGIGLSAYGVIASLAILSLPPPAAAQTYTWTGAGTSWNTPTNWSPVGIPNSPAALVNFTGNGTFYAVNIASNVSAQSLSFSNPTLSYSLTSNAGVSLSGLTAINMLTGTQTINLANIATGSLLFTGIGPAALTISSTTLNSSNLIIGPNTVIGTPGSGGITVTGSGATTFSGSFATSATPNNQVIGGLTKTGVGALIFSGNGSNLVGGTTMAGGTVIWDYSTNTATKNAGGALVMSAGHVQLNGNAGVPITETVSSTTINSGACIVYPFTNGGATQSVTINLGALSRTGPATLYVGLFSGGLATTSTGLTNGILGGWATANGTSWATKVGSNIATLTPANNDVYSPGTNTNVTTGSGIPSGFTTNSLRMNPGVTAQLSGTNTIQSGGILIPVTGAAAITGGTLTSGTGELIVHTFSDVTISSALSAPGGLTKNGTNFLTLSGDTSGLNGAPLNINQGFVRFTAAQSFNALTSIRLNERSNNSTGVLFQLPDGQDGATPAAFVLSGAFGSAGNYFQNSALNSRITFNGPISSALPFTPIQFYSSDLASGFNLAAANSFTGNVSIVGGVLGIVSDANLGNASNIVALSNIGSNLGGIEFLNDGTNLQHPVSLVASGRFIVNGANSNSINSTISGIGSLTKEGTGTLLLSNSGNSYTGGTNVTAGRLLLGSATGIPANTNVTVAAGAEFNTAGLSNIGSAIGTVTLNGGTLRVPSGNGDYYLNKLAIGSNGSTVNFAGSSNFWLHLTGAGAGITFAGNTTWTGAPSSRIQNDTSAPIDIYGSNFFGTLNNGIILANGVNGQGFRLTGITSGNNLAVMALTNPNNTADLIADSTGYLQVADMAYLGSGSVTLQNSAFHFRPGTLWYVGGTASSTKPISLGVGNGQIYVFNPGTNLTLSGLISGPGTLQVAGAYDAPSTLTLTADNTFTGALNIQYAGILSVASITNGGVAGPLGAASNSPFNLQLGYPLFRGGTLQYTGPTATTDRGMALYASFETNFTNVNAIEVANPAANLRFNGQFTGSGGLTKTGPGTLSLGSATNDYAGGTFVNAGRLALAVASAIPVGSNVTVAAGGTFDTGGFGNIPATAIGTVALNGGIMRAASSDGDFYWLNKLTTDVTGGTLDVTAATGFTGLAFVNAGAAITANGNTNFNGSGTTLLINGIGIDGPGAEMPITIAPTATLTSGLNLLSNYGIPSHSFRITGGGTLYLTNTPQNIAYVTVNHGRLRMDNLTPVMPGSFDLTLNAGTLAYGGGSLASNASFALGSSGGTLEITNALSTLTLTGTIAGADLYPLTKTGPGTLILNSPTNTYAGGLIISGGRLDVSNDAQLGAANPVINPAGTLRYTADATTGRTFTLFNGALDVSSGALLSLNGANVSGGFLRGPGTYVLTGGASLTGVTTFTTTTVNVTGPASATNFANNGAITVASSQTFTMNYSTNGAAGLITVNGTANVSDFVSYGRTVINPGGSMTSTQGGLALGGGSVTNIGIYNPSTGQVTPGGTINFGSGNMRVQGGFVRNNGTITGTGDLIIDYLGLVKGAGEIDTPRAPIRINGGQLLAGNTPGLSRVATFSLVSTGVTGGDLSNATGVAGPPIGSTGTQLSGWSVFEYGNMDNTGGSAQVQGTPSARAIWQFRTVMDSGNYDTPGVPANFNAAQSYTWPIIRPRSAADAGNPNNITPINTVAMISILDTSTNMTVPLTNENLNAYARFDDSLWNWGNVPVPERGMFSFVLLPDASNNANRVIGVLYSPVPEPGLILAAAFMSLAGWRFSARHRRGNRV